MKIGHLLFKAYKDISLIDKELILNFILCCDRAYLYTHEDVCLKNEQIKKFEVLYLLRKKDYPLAYVLKKKPFYKYCFFTPPGVFIPRPETESLISAVLSQWNKEGKWHIMDFGCGSGAIGLTLLKLFPKARLTALDISKKALRTAYHNAGSLRVLHRCRFLHKDLCQLQNLSLKLKPADIITANPPYVDFEDETVEKGVRLFEPAKAIFSPQGGLYHIRSWLYSASNLLKIKGSYLFEIGWNSSLSLIEKEVKDMKLVSVFKDLSSINRVLQFQKNNG